MTPNYSPLPEVISDARLLMGRIAEENGITVSELVSSRKRQPLASIRLQAIREVATAFKDRLTTSMIGSLFNRDRTMVSYVTRGHSKQRFVSKPTGYQCNCGRLATKQLACGHWVCGGCE